MAVLLHGLGIRVHPQGGDLLLFHGLSLQSFCNIVPDPAHGLHRGEAAVADGGVHIVPVVKGELPQQLGLQLVIGDGGKGQPHPLHFGLKGGPAVEDVFLPLLFLEPLLDLGPGLIALADIQPVPAGALGALGGEDFADVAVI